MLFSSPLAVTPLRCEAYEACLQSRAGTTKQYGYHGATKTEDNHNIKNFAASLSQTQIENNTNTQMLQLQESIEITMERLQIKDSPDTTPLTMNTHPGLQNVFYMGSVHNIPIIIMGSFGYSS